MVIRMISARAFSWVSSSCAEQGRRSARAVAALALVLVAGTAGAADLAGPALSATFGPDGRLWRAVPRAGHLEVDYSTDRGVSFAAPVRVGPKRQRMRATPEDRPSIAVDRDGRVFVTWAADARVPWTRLVAWSTDGGRSFTAPVQVSDAADKATQNQTVVQAVGDGTAQVFWVESQPARPGEGPTGVLRLAVFDALGRTPPRRSTLHDSMCECCRLAAGIMPSGHAAVLGRLVFDGHIRDTGLVTVAVDGRATARRVSDDEWAIDACPEHGPALALAPDGTTHFAWFTLGSRRQGLFYAHANPGGEPSAPMPIGDKARLAGHADVGVLGRTVALTWREFDGRRTSIHAMLSPDGGATWQAPREIAGSDQRADYPFVLSDGRSLYVSWYAADLGYRLIALSPSG